MQQPVLSVMEKEEIGWNAQDKTLIFGLDAGFTIL
jgi:hypothetical protein